MSVLQKFLGAVYSPNDTGTFKTLVVGSGGITNGGPSVGSDTNVISVTGATAAPTAAQSGTSFLLNRAAGIVVTLPAPVIGAKYTFIVQTSVTSTSYKIITDAGTTLLQGAVISATTTASVFESLIGTSNIAVTMNGTTTGGLVGTQLTFTCISATLWQVTGVNFTSGTTASPFATS